jgi:hypothetical protein
VCPAGRLCAPGPIVSRGLPTAPFKAATPAGMLVRPPAFRAVPQVSREKMPGAHSPNKACLEGKRMVSGHTGNDQ